MSVSTPIATSAAEQRASANFRANRDALDSRQPGTSSLGHVLLESVEWIFARDGSLTCLLPGERWWGDCSLPRRAGQFMYKKMTVPGAVACFLRPEHAAHLRVTLDLLEPQQAIIALVPEAQTFWVMLHCEDFSADIAAGRLWFAVGSHWESHLAELFITNPGLPTPSQFIRAIAVNSEPADAMIGPAQKTFADESDRRAIQIRNRVAAWKRPAQVRKLCVVAPSRFRLWNDAPHALQQVLQKSSEFEVSQFDSDCPSTASPALLNKLAGAGEAVICANLSRADLPGVFPAAMPVVTWVTFPRMPAFDASAPSDALLLADANWKRQAAAAGWPEARLTIASWPTTCANPSGNAISLIADTRSLDVPPSVEGFSSQRLLWERISHELLNNPFAVGTDIDGYLKRRQSEADVDGGHLDRTLFIEQLIVPAYQQGLARLLLQHGVQLALHGAGWSDVPEFAPYTTGPIATRERFNQIIASAAALIHAWPISYSHPISAAGLPVIRASSAADLLRQINAPRRQPPRDTSGVLSAELIRSIL